MNVFTNEEYYDAQVRRSKLFRTIGIICIILSFGLSLLVNYNAYLVCGAYPLLIAGLPLWSIGRSMQRRLTSTPHVDKLLNEELKGLNNKYTLHHYATVGGRLIKHLLVMPTGLLAIETRESNGPISCSAGKGGDRWRGKAGILERFSGMNPPVGNPSIDLAAAIEAATGLVSEIGKPSVPVMGMVVFTRNPDITMEGCTYAALPLDEVKDTVRDLQFELGGEKSENSRVNMMLTTEDRRKLNATLQPAKPAAPKPAAIKPAPAKPAPGPTSRRTVDDKR